MYSVTTSTASCPTTEMSESFPKQEVVYVHQPNGHLTPTELLAQQSPPSQQPQQQQQQHQHQQQQQQQQQQNQQHQQQQQQQHNHHHHNHNHHNHNHHHHNHHHQHHNHQQPQQQQPQNNIIVPQQQPKQVFDLNSFGNSRKPYRCSICRKGFTLRAYLNRHQLAPEEEKHFYCQECGKAFSQRDKLKNHERTHSGEKPFACSHCDKAFSQRDRMKNHERTHHGVGLETGGPNGVLIANGTGEGGQNGVVFLPRERPYLCGVCHKSFARKDHLRKHQRTHTGERPFQCGVCLKSFSRRDHLKKHQRTHSGEKPYECFVCSKSYSRKDHLNKHERTHTTGDMLPTGGTADNNNGDCGIAASVVMPAENCMQQQQQQQEFIDQKPSMCKYCPKVFVTQTQLEMHELTHTQPQEELHGPISISLNPTGTLTQTQQPQHIQVTNVAPLQQISLQPQQQQHQLTSSTSSANIHQLLSQPVVATALRQPLLQAGPGQTATITIGPGGAITQGNYTTQPITLQQPVTMATANNYAWTNSFPVSSSWATGWVNPNIYTLDQLKCESPETTHNIQTLLQ